MNDQTIKSLQTLANVLSTAKKVVDEEWAKLTPEKKAKIRDNILKRAEARKAKQNGGPTEWGIDRVSIPTVRYVR